MRVSAADVAAALPDITPRQGAELAALVRTAMTEYLHARTAPASVKVPAELRELARRPNAVAVTLRSGGSVVAVEVHSAADLGTNLIVAAMQAMRSPRLPDRVDDKVLAGLTVEVEVLGRRQPTTAGQVDEAIVPGLTGLQCGSGSSTVHVLPSAAYVLGLSPQRMLREAMHRMGQSGESQSPSPAAGASLAVFAARHYVEYPGSTAVELYRGKLSPAPPELDDKAALDAAASIGRYLAARQEADGWFTVGEGETTPVDQLYVTWALVRLAARRPWPVLAECIQRALAAADRKITRRQGRAVVNAGSPDDTLAATALLALALETDRTKQAVELRRQLLAGLTAGLDAPSVRPGGGPATAAAPGSPGVTRGRCLAAMALTTDPACEPFLASARREMSAAPPATAEEALWAFRAGAARNWPPDFGDSKSPTGLTMQGPAAPADGRGGFAAGRQPPETYLTGLAVICMEQLLARRDGIPSATAGALARQLADARRFCANMIYQPGEAYFAADPNSWVGAVRATPGGAPATAKACAAAIEALLTAGQ